MAGARDSAVKQLIDLLGRRSGWLIGAIGLAAWLALLYFMVGDVL